MEDSYKIAKQYILIRTDNYGDFNTRQFDTHEDAWKEMQRQYNAIYNTAQHPLVIIDYYGILENDKAMFRKTDVYENKYRYDWHIVEVEMNVPIFDCE